LGISLRNKTARSFAGLFLNVDRFKI